MKATKGAQHHQRARKAAPAARSFAKEKQQRQERASFQNSVDSPLCVHYWMGVKAARAP
jgi:hypothetical protein